MYQKNHRKRKILYSISTQENGRRKCYENVLKHRNKLENSIFLFQWSLWQMLIETNLQSSSSSCMLKYYSVQVWLNITILLHLNCINRWWMSTPLHDSGRIQFPSNIPSCVFFFRVWAFSAQAVDLVNEHQTLARLLASMLEQISDQPAGDDLYF